MIDRIIVRIVSYLIQKAPNAFILNFLLMLYPYWKIHGRLPRAVGSKRATINDFIFARMVRNSWTALEQACADKEYAKIIARGQVGVKASETVCIFRIDDRTTSADVERWLSAYVGQRLVLKPAHSCGHVIFLNQPLNADALARQLAHAKRNFFTINRETQYVNLERRLILETYVETFDDINDFKFYCAYGKLLLCQIDTTRFTKHKRVYVGVPDFNIVDIHWKNYDRPVSINKPANWDELLAVASALSAPFPFVRIDLYNTRQGIFFGEYTFTPGAGMNALSSEQFGIDLLKQVIGADKKRPGKNAPIDLGE